VALRRAGVGGIVGGNFVVALDYVDDIVLLAPFARVLRMMLAICDNHAKAD